MFRIRHAMVVATALAGLMGAATVTAATAAPAAASTAAAGYDCAKLVGQDDGLAVIHNRCNYPIMATVKVHHHHHDDDDDDHCVFVPARGESWIEVHHGWADYAYQCDWWS